MSVELISNAEIGNYEAKFINKPVPLKTGKSEINNL